MPAFRISPAPITSAFDQASDRLVRLGFADALWSRRLDVWTADAGVQAKIANRLGWLDALDFISGHVDRLSSLRDDVRSGGFTDVVLLGMGGSSLAPEVLRRVLGVADGLPRFRMLDSVDPDAVRAAMANAGTSLFILASKSGTTIEPNSMAAEARRRLVEAGVQDWGSRFLAITDEGTALHRHAVEQRFRHVFVNPSDIGGRYSALSFFGMVPAALIGVDVGKILDAAREMETACRLPTPSENPGLALGALMAAGVAAGRDKLTLLLPDRLRSLGLWIEQLVAESTGKQGTGVVPIAGERTLAPSGDDRIAVVVRVGGEPPHPARVDALRDAGLPVAEIDVDDVNAIGAEFLRWEVATATAGLLMGINPFDEPNVQQAKDATRVLLETHRDTGRLPVPEPHGSIEGARLTISRAAEEALAGRAADEFLTVIRRGDYFGLLVYLPPDDPAIESALEDFRADVGARAGCATMFGYGPRYLHSTGQLHKGGANNGVFVIVTAPAVEDLAIPGERFSFQTLEMAQALGDFQSLDRTGRRVLHVHLPNRDVATLRRVTQALAARHPAPRA